MNLLTVIAELKICMDAVREDIELAHIDKSAARKARVNTSLLDKKCKEFRRLSIIHDKNKE